MMKFLSNLKTFKNDIVQAAISDLGDAHGICQVPPLYKLANSNIDKPLYWDTVVHFRKPLRKLMLHTKEMFRNQSVF